MLYLPVSFLFLADQLLKALSVTMLVNNELVWHCGEIGVRRYIHNDGLILPLLATMGVILLAKFVQKRYDAANIQILFAGTFSNMCDRVLHGGVVDYFQAYSIVFNLADCYILVGIFVTVLWVVRNGVEL